MSALMELGTIGGSYGITTLSGMLMHFHSTSTKFREESAKREHDRWKLFAEKSYRDVNRARSLINEKDKKSGFLKGSFIGWTRRLLAWVVILIFVALIIGELNGHPINLVYEVPHQFLGFSWTRHIIKTVQGIVMTPYIREYCNVVLGFYMGHFTVRSFK